MILEIQGKKRNKNDIMKRIYVQQEISKRKERKRRKKFRSKLKGIKWRTKRGKKGKWKKEGNWKWSQVKKKRLSSRAWEKRKHGNEKKKSEKIMDAGKKYFTTNQKDTIIKKIEGEEKNVKKITKRNIYEETKWWKDRTFLLGE